MSGEAILSAENSGKPLGGWGSVPKPAGRALKPPGPQTPLTGGEGVAAPRKNPIPALGLKPFGLGPPMKNLGHAPVKIVYYAPPLMGGGIKRFCLTTSDVCLSVAYIGPKSRTERPRKTKIGIQIARVTRD